MTHLDEDVEEVAADIAGLRYRLGNQQILTHPVVMTELRKLDVQLVTQLSSMDGASGRHRSRALREESRGSRQQVEDVAGYDHLKPDPLTATTPAEFMDTLRRYRAWSGEPSWRNMARDAGQVVVHSTMYAAMQNDTLPKLDLVKAVVTGCGGSQDDVRAFVTAWRRIGCGSTGTTIGSTSPLPAPVLPALSLVRS